MTRSWTGYSDSSLIAHLRDVRKCEREVADLGKPYDRSEWGGVDRATNFKDLADEVDALIEECHRRHIDVAPILWPEDVATKGH